MTLEEAKNIIDIAIAEVEWCYPLEYAVAFEMAKEAMEKQIPKKPISDEMKRIKCPNGHNIPTMVKNSKMKYCPFCGQKLDWSKDETDSK